MSGRAVHLRSFVISLVALSSMGIGECGSADGPAEPRSTGDHEGPIYANDMAARDEGLVTPDLESGLVAPPSSCYGEMGSGLFVCDGARCNGVASCRVANSQRCSVPVKTAFDFGGCEGSPLSSTCLGLDVSVFGSPAPWITSAGLHPNGADFDSGVTLSDKIALRSHRAVLRGTFHAPSCIDGASCLETVSFGVTTQTGLGARAHVSPLLALRFVAERSEVQLVSGDVVLGRTPFPDAGEDAYTLELLPEGRAVASNQGGAFATVAFTPSDDAEVVLFGRNVNHGAPAPEGAGLTEFSVDVALCDVPDAWEARTPLAVVDTTSREVSFEGLGGATAAVVGPETIVAFHASDDTSRPRIFAASQSDSASLALVNDGLPIVEGTLEHDLGGARDPELFVEGPTAHLYYTALGADGSASIGHASGTDLKHLDVAASPVLDPRSWSDLTSVAEPTVATAYDRSLVMIVNATFEDGAHALVTFTAPSPTGPFARVVGSPLETLTRRTGSPQSPVFDSEEITSPALENVDGAFHLYYLGRRGTRRGLGLYATDDFVHFRYVSDTPLFVGSNGTFDALGPTAADVLVEAGVVSLVYIGTDGVTDTLGRTTRESFVESW